MKRSSSTNTTRTTLSLMLMITLLATSLIAQEPADDPQNIPAAPVQAMGLAVGMEMPSKEKMGGAKQFQMIRVYAMEIRRVDAAAKLESAQKTKLTIGSKGLAKKKSQEFVKNMMNMGMGMGMAMPAGGVAAAAPPKNDEPEVKFVEVKSFDDIDANLKAMLDGGLSMDPKPYDDPEWLKLVKAVLKPEQWKEYEQVIAANKLRTDKAMVAAGMAKLSQELALSKDQEGQLTSLVLEHMAKARRAPGPSIADERLPAMPMGGDHELVVELAKVGASALRTILTPPQLEQVNLKLAVLEGMVGQINPDIQAAPLEGK